MSQLAEHVAEIRATTAELLARADGTAEKRCAWGICHPEGPCHCPEPATYVVDSDDAVQPRSYFRGVAALGMRTALTVLGHEHWELGPKWLSIGCRCLRVLRRPVDVALVECPCGRAYCWNGRSVYAVKPEYL